MPTRKVIILPSVSAAELRDALNKAGGSISDAAEILGVHRATVYRLMDRYGIELKRVVA